MKFYLKIGFIGLGLMGNPMAKNIHKAGFDLHVFNRNKKKTEEFKKLGAKVHETIKDLTNEVDVIVTMVTGPKDVQEVLFGKNGVVTAGTKALTVIDMSTIGPTAAIEIARKLKKHGIHFVDAPVTGSVPRAITGELTIFIGGAKDVVEKVKPVLSAMGKTLHHIGENGAGQAVKLVNNHLVAATVSALAEGMLLGDILKIKREKLAEALGETPAFSPFMKLKLPNFVKNDFPTLFSVANMQKDLSLAKKEVRKVKKNLSILTLIEKIFKQGIDQKIAQEDISAIVKVMERN